MRNRVLLAAGLGVLIGLSRPASACCQLGGAVCGDPFAVDCNNGVVCFVPYRTCPSCTCTTTNGGKTCLSTSALPGSVPTLQIVRSLASPGDLDLSWAPSCNPASANFAVHEGLLGSWYSHEPRICTTTASLAATVTPFGGNRYYLIAPIAGDFTGSFGTGSAGIERPDGSSSCTEDRALAPCP